jgi:hypothetical protein
MSIKSNSVEINQVSPYQSQQKIKDLNKDLLIKNLKNEIISLSKEIIKLKADNGDLRSRVSLIYSMEQNFKSAKETINDMREQTNKIINDKDQEQRKLKIKIEQMELEKTLDQLKNNRNMTLYNQKMSVVHHIEHENKVYRDEVNDLKIKNEMLERATKEKMESLDILNQIKFSQFKKKMIDNLKEAKDNVSKLNLEYMDLNGKITILQNHQLLSEIEFQKEHIDNLEKENIRLKKRIFDLEKELAVHKKVEIKLAIKAKNNTNNSNLNSFNKKNNVNIIKQGGYNNNNNNNNNVNQNNDIALNQMSDKGVTLLPITNNNFKSINTKNTLNKEKINDILSSNNNNNNNTNNIINEYSSRANKTVSKSSTSYNQKFRIESGNNNNNINSNIPSERNEMIDVNFKYIKFNKIIKKKNDEIEKLKIIIDNLKNKLDNYIGKNKGLYSFLEESINLFFNECEQNLKEKNINIDLENIKKFDFELLNNDEKYSILVLLMKYLLPLVVINTNSKNVKENIFKTNINVNLINRNLPYNSAEKYLKEPSLKNAFIGKKIKTNLFFDSKSIQYYGNGNLIPVLRKTEYSNDSRIKDNRFKTVIK